MTIDGARLFIAGRFRAAAEVEPVTEAATEELLGHGASATPAEVDDAVTAARSALPEWRSASQEHRAAVMAAFAAALRSREETTGELISREIGLPVMLSRKFNGIRPAMLLEYYASLQVPVEEVRPSTTGHTIVRHEAVGVVAAIAPWNVPHLLAIQKIAPALAAGCTIVLKSSPETALDAMILAEAGRCGGVSRRYPQRGGGRSCRQRLPRRASRCRQSGVHGIDGYRTCDRRNLRAPHASGHPRAGRQICRHHPRGRRPRCHHAGNARGLARRQRPVVLLVHAHTGARSRYAEVVDATAALADSLVVGNPLDPATETGPLVSARQHQRVLDYIDIGKSSDAKLVAGGSIPKDQPRGWFVSPTVFADVANTDRIAREEIFGPVLTVIPYDSESEAIDTANDSEFGLGGTVWSADPDRAVNVARSIVTGTIGINSYERDVGSPFGGVKGSRLGRELGPEGIAEYQRLQSIYLADTGGTLSPC